MKFYIKTMKYTTWKILQIMNISGNIDVNTKIYDPNLGLVILG